MLVNVWSDLWQGLVSRTEGPLKFRFLLQPATAIFLGIHGGIRDWRAGKPAYFWEFLMDPAKRKELLHEGWHSLEKLFILAVVLDCAYQLVVLRWIYPVDALAVAFFLAVVPYLFVRGPVNRILRVSKLPARQSTKAQAGNPPTVRKAGA
jgi:hypothetical protein